MHTAASEPAKPIPDERFPRNSSANEFVDLEAGWRQFADCQEHASRVLVSRWTSRQPSTGEAVARFSSAHHLICLALSATSAELMSNDRQVLHQGRVLPGMVQVSGPGETVRGVFRAPCDFLHLRVADWYLAQLSEKMPSALLNSSHRLRASGFRRDHAIEQLTRAILAAQTAAGELNAAFVGGITDSILIRLLTIDSSFDQEMPPSRVLPLAKWRLDRVRKYVDGNFDKPIRLADMAAAAGLTRMHFAAQFRSATGLRPHDYLLHHRIRNAQNMLTTRSLSVTEIAFRVGFENQGHFSTVFRRIVGDTPGQWQKRHRE